MSELSFFSKWIDRLSMISDLLDKDAIQELNDFFAFNTSGIAEGDDKSTSGDFQAKLLVVMSSMESISKNDKLHFSPMFVFLLDEYLDLVCSLLIKFNYSSLIDDEHVTVLKRVMSSLADMLYDAVNKPESIGANSLRSKFNFIYKEKEKVDALSRSKLSMLINDSVASHSKRVETKVNSIRNDATQQFNKMMNENLQVILKVEESENILRSLEIRIRDVLDKATWLPDAADKVISDAESKLRVLSEIEASCKTKEESIDSSFRISNGYSMGRAFKERGDSLQTSIVKWTIAFFCSLISIPALVLFMCDFDLTQLSTDYKASLARSFIIIPSIWMAWFSAKQYAHSSKLKEDYEYKLAMAKAYEAYKEEAASHSDEMMGMLLRNSLEKITENPVRLYAGQENNTPITELLSRFTPEQLMEVLKLISAKQSTK
ncbi:hypothetical protein [Aeromonas veronii]|uniref:hypothetical protein n=1 Tax=Aeromonas veronii TaxID=654 RepID=UPI001116262A|nr:hypothetical protein [Aeromonas veronii]